MTDDQLETKIEETAGLERKISVAQLQLIALADERKLYARRGFSTLKKWLIARQIFRPGRSTPCRCRPPVARSPEP